MTLPKRSNLGLIVRGDDSGLGNQTRALAYMLKPDRVLYINSKPFNKAEQHFDWYDSFNGFSSLGFPDHRTVRRFLTGLTHVLTAETFYSYDLIKIANASNIKTFNQYNYEFNDNLRQDLPIPYKWLAPSHWHVDKMEAKFESVVYLPPPTFSNDFKSARQQNMTRTGYRRFVHIVGKRASHDRNGTEDILQALQYCQAEFELVIRSQHELEYQINDRRVTFDVGNKLTQSELYADFDALIMPRRYGGLCLPMNEALCSGLPTIMTDISPNNKVLPEDWLVQAKVERQFMARTAIDCYQSDIKQLASLIDKFATMSQEQLDNEKTRAFDIGFNEYDADNLRAKYAEVLEL